MPDPTITALAIRSTRLEWTTLEQKKGRNEIGQQREVAFDLPEGSPGLPVVFTRGDVKLESELVAKLRAAGRGIGGRLALALPTEQILLRVVRLPTTELAEIQGMAELQVDKFSPFPSDLMATSVEVLDQKDGASRVLIASVQREYIDRMGGLFNAAELYPREVDIAILGWWRILKEHGEVPAEGRHLTLVIDEHSTELMVTQDGVPVMFRALGSHARLSPPEAAAEIAEEINYTLTIIEGEWGAVDTGSLRVWHWDASPAEFLERLKQDCSIPIETRHLEVIPALTEGLARRAAERAPGMVDLAPPQWREAILSRATRKKFLIGVGSVVGLWLLAMGILYGAVMGRTGSVRALQKQVDALREPRAQVVKLMTQVEALERYSTRSDSPLECLMVVSARLPEGIDLTQFSYTKNEDVNIRGQAQGGDLVTAFAGNMEDESLFANVQIERINETERGTQFGLNLVLPKGAP
jgi:Tfp pilus assembly protein PilN